MKNKVTFQAKDILQNGIRVGRLEGTRSEVWVVLFSMKHALALHEYTQASLACQDEYMNAPEGQKPAHGGHTNLKYPLEQGIAVARCKHFEPTRKAKHLIKFLLERNTSDAVIAAIGFDKAPDARNSPMGWAEQQGYVSLGAARAAREQATPSQAAVG